MRMRKKITLVALGVALGLLIGFVLNFDKGTIVYSNTRISDCVPVYDVAGDGAGGSTSRRISGSKAPLPASLVGASQEDEALVEFIKHHMFADPAPGPRELDLPSKEHYSQVGQSETVDDMLKGRENGFFIECGAAQGEMFSNSLFFEKSRNWTGLLVEANPSYFESVRRKRRVNLVNACLSPLPTADIMNFTFATLMGGLSDRMEASHLDVISKQGGVSGRTEVACLPLFSILKAINISHVDYFSLDVEGPEIDILRTIPFDKVTFDVFTVEIAVQGCQECRDRKLKELNSVMSARGYKLRLLLNNQDAVYRRQL